LKLTILLIVMVVIGSSMLSGSAFGLRIVRPWLQAFIHGTPVSMFHILGMRLRGNPQSLLLDAHFALGRSGAMVSSGDIENMDLDRKNRIFTREDRVAGVRMRPSNHSAELA